MKKQMLFVLLFVFGVVNSNGEIKKEASLCGQKICFHWWPVLPSVPGWHEQSDSSRSYEFSAMAPDGFTFSNAEVVIYARAFFKKRMPKVNSLQQFIQNDKKEFEDRDSSIEAKEAGELRTADGFILQSLTFFPAKKGNWERVAYGEEVDQDGNAFFVIFTVSARCNMAYQNAQSSYEYLIAHYQGMRKTNPSKNVQAR